MQDFFINHAILIMCILLAVVIIYYIGLIVQFKRNRRKPDELPRIPEDEEKRVDIITFKSLIISSKTFHPLEIRDQSFSLLKNSDNDTVNICDINLVKLGTVTKNQLIDLAALLAEARVKFYNSDFSDGEYVISVKISKVVR